MEGRCPHCKSPELRARSACHQGVHGASLPTATQYMRKYHLPLILIWPQYMRRHHLLPLILIWPPASRLNAQSRITSQPIVHTWRGVHPINHSLHHNQDKVLCTNALICAITSCHAMRCMQLNHITWLRINQCIYHWWAPLLSSRETQRCPTKGHTYMSFVSLVVMTPSCMGYVLSCWAHML